MRKLTAVFLLLGAAAYSGEGPFAYLDDAREVAQSGKIEPALKAVDKAVNIWRKKGEITTPVYAEAITLTGTLMERLGQNPRTNALPLYRDAIEIRSKAGEHDTVELALLYELCAHVLEGAGDAEGATTLRDKARPIRIADVERMTSELRLHGNLNAAEPLAPVLKIGGGVKAPRVTYRVGPSYSLPASILQIGAP